MPTLDALMFDSLGRHYTMSCKQTLKIMKNQFYNVMVDCNGYPKLENGGEELTLDEAHEFIKEMEEYFPDNFYTIVPFVFIERQQEHRTYSRYEADGWEDIYQINCGYECYGCAKCEEI